MDSPFYFQDDKNIPGFYLIDLNGKLLSVTLIR